MWIYDLGRADWRCLGKAPAFQPYCGNLNMKEIWSLWASLLAQTVKNPPVMRETWVWFPGWEDRLEEDMATHSSILAWRIPMDWGAWWAMVHGVAGSDTTEQLNTQHTVACGIFPDKGLNPCPLYWEADYYPLYHQESLHVSFWIFIFSGTCPGVGLQDHVVAVFR